METWTTINKQGVLYTMAPVIHLTSQWILYDELVIAGEKKILMYFNVHHYVVIKGKMS